jgi:hypothetical protein
VDVDEWSAEDISSFQDAIYKSEKDFHQVATELGNRSVKECVAFYYTWKKACPDDYRKLRNLRRKRQLLEQQLDFSTYVDKERSQPDHLVEAESSDEEYSGTESDITNPSYINSGHNNMDSSPERMRAEKLARLNQTQSPLSAERKASTIRFNVPSSSDMPMSSPLGGNGGLSSAFSATNATISGNNNNVSGSGYPWLHGEMFPSPCSSTASTTHESSTATGNNSGYGTASGSSMNAGSSVTSDLFEGMSAGGGMDAGLFSNNFHMAHKVRGAVPKKGAQPSADGFFHCRLCEKRFEKVKSLNAHMKSHAMKARAEAEAQAQIQHQNSSGSTGAQTNRFADLGAASTSANTDLMLGGSRHDSPEDELNLSPLNLCQPSAAVAAAAALGLNNLNRLAAAQQQAAAAAKMQHLFSNNRDLVSAAMTAMTSGTPSAQTTAAIMGMAGQAGGALNPTAHPMHHAHSLANSQQQQMAAMAAAAAHQQASFPHQNHHQQTQGLDAATIQAATSLSTLHQIHSNLQQQQGQLANFQAPQAAQPQQYPTTIIH